MPSTVRPRRKRPGRYHHGDLRRALIQEAVRTIQTQGVDRLTLRKIAERLGVSRTALYRHFADKSALLAAVATEGFRMLRHTLGEAWEEAEDPSEGFDDMGVAYVRFALENPSHYRVMFGGFVRDAAGDSELEAEASGAFQVLVDSLTALQRRGRVRGDDPLSLARFVWAMVHGIATLAIDGQLPGETTDIVALTRFANERLRSGIDAIR